MTHSIIYPELGEKTSATIEFSCSHCGGYYLTTDLELKGRGIRKVGNGEHHKRGKKTYQATELALEKLKKQYDTCYIALL